MTKHPPPGSPLQQQLIVIIVIIIIIITTTSSSNSSSSLGQNWLDESPRAIALARPSRQPSCTATSSRSTRQGCNTPARTTTSWLDEKKGKEGGESNH